MKKCNTAAAVDDVLIALKWWGPYQKLQFVMLMLPVLPTVLHSISVVFIGREAEHKCASLPPYHVIEDGAAVTAAQQLPSDFLSVDDIILNNNMTLKSYTTKDFDKLHNSTTVTNSNKSTVDVVYGKCYVSVYDESGTMVSSARCPHGYDYAEPKDRTFVSEWDLVCEHEALSDTSQMILGAGMTVGGFFFASLSDRYGRKMIYMLAHGSLFLVAIATAFAPNFIVFATLRFFTGATQMGVALVSSVLRIEQLPTLRRALPSQVGIFLHPASMLTVGLLAFLTMNLSWRYTQLLFAGFSFYVVFQWWITDESLRWLLANGRVTEAERIVKKAAKQNKVDVKEVITLFRERVVEDAASTALVEDKENCSQPTVLIRDKESIAVEQKQGKHLEDGQEMLVEKSNPEKIGLLDALKNRHVLMVTAICSFMWFSDNTAYYGLVMTSSSLVDDLYLGYTVNILAELPAAVAYVLCINRIGRKKCVWIFNLIGGLSLAASVFLSTISAAENIPGVELLKVVVVLIGKFGIAVGFGVLWIYTPELFPTNIRNTCLGASSVIGRIGGMLTPYSRTLARHIPWAPGLIFTVLCLLTSALTFFFLPETQGRELPQTIEDMEVILESQQKKRNEAKV